MLDDDKLYRHTLWAGVVVLITMIGSCTVGNMDRRAKWADAVKNGADPMVVACALYDQSEAEKVTCALLATKK
jgi:hypothetical protein